MTPQPPQPEVGATTTGERPDRPRPSRLRRAIRWAMGLLAVGLLLASLWQQREGLADALARIEPPVIVLSGFLALLALFASMLSWRSLLHATGHRLPLPAAARLYFLTQIGKYVPGSVWPVVAQIELGREQGVSAAHSGVAAALNLLIGIATGAIVGLVSLLLTEGSPGQYWWLVFVPLLLLALRPSVVRWTVVTLLRIARRPAPDLDLEWRSMVASAGWSLVMWLLFGLHVYVLAGALSASIGVVQSVGAYALAWVIGFLVFVAPAGAGAREFSLVLLLSPPLGRPEALAVAVLSRVMGIVADVIVALLGIAAERAHVRHTRRRTAEAGPSDTA